MAGKFDHRFINIPHNIWEQIAQIENLKGQWVSGAQLSPQILGSSFKRHLILTIKGLIYSTQCLKPPSMKFVRTKMAELPREDENGKKFKVFAHGF